MTPAEPDPFYRSHDEAHVTNRGIADHAVQGRANAMRPSDSPDYQRIVTITQEIEAGESRGETSHDQLGTIADFTAVRRHGMSRAEQLLADVQRVPSQIEVITLFANSWTEGFMIGLLFEKEGGHQEGHGFPLDDMKISDIKSELQKLFMDRNIEAEYSDRADLYALGYVGAIKARKTWDLCGQRFDLVSEMLAPVMSLWLEGFYYGGRFEQLGGHRAA